MDFFHLVQKLLIEDHFDLELELEIPGKPTMLYDGLINHCLEFF